MSNITMLSFFCLPLSLPTETLGLRFLSSKLGDSEGDIFFPPSSSCSKPRVDKKFPAEIEFVSDEIQISLEVARPLGGAAAPKAKPTMPADPFSMLQQQVDMLQKQLNTLSTGPNDK